MKKIIIFAILYAFLSFNCNGLEDNSFITNFSKASIDTKKVLSGGPGKDGIPAINNPHFVKTNKADLGNEIRGILVQIGTEERFYPYNILVWHEIVNDNIGGFYFTVTFCPLCGSAIAFNRKIDGKVHKFGVSGYLYESNLLMYDNISESFWSQAMGEAVIGDYMGTKLEIVGSYLMDFGTVKKEYPNVKVLSRKTGFKRNYDIYPYGNYEESDGIYFPISKRNNKYHLKEIMYVFRYDNISFTFPLKQFKSKEYRYPYNGKEVLISKKRGKVQVEIGNRTIPGYHEMWFSWVIHNLDMGIVIDKIN